VGLERTTEQEAGWARGEGIRCRHPDAESLLPVAVCDHLAVSRPRALIAGLARAWGMRSPRPLRVWQGADKFREHPRYQAILKRTRLHARLAQ
jgi:hypothetical protein